MLRLIKYLKGSIFTVIVIIIFLAIQAIANIALPNYTSNIVNIGIQQNGIENSVPYVIQESELDKIMLFMTDSNRQLVKEDYKLIDKNNLSTSQYDTYVKEYPALSNQALYILNTKNSSDLKQLNNILGEPILLVKTLESDKTQADQIKGMLLSKLPAVQSEQLKNDSIFAILEMLPQDELNKITNEAGSKIKDMPQSLITQESVTYIKSQYEAIGVNVNKLQTDYIWKTGLIMVAIALISMLASIIVTFFASKVAAKIGMELRGKIFKKVMSFSNSELDKFSTASLITRSANDVQQVQNLMVMLLRLVFYAPILGIGGFIEVLYTNASMSWIIGVIILVIIGCVTVIFVLAVPKYKRVQQLVDKVNLVIRENLTGMLVIRAFTTQKHEEERFDGVNKDLTKTTLFVTRVTAVMMPLVVLIMNVSTIAIVWLGAYKINQGTMQVGDMMAYIQYVMLIIIAFVMVTMLSIMLPRAAVSAQRIDEVLETESTINDPKNPKVFDKNKKGFVEFKNVSFKYPNAEKNVLSNITFTAKPGETTAIIGSTGSGKSTIVNLIPRFYDVSEGEVLVDGVNVKDVSQHDLRGIIGYVPQKAILFSGTIDSNIKYNNDNINDEDVKFAVDISQSKEFIEQKPEGLNSRISQGGANVSGGQKQRLSIARAIAKRPEIYVFDDSFSALDFKTDAKLRKALNENTADSTVILVAQRVSTILHADKILVIDEGKIVGMGKHRELLDNCEVYKQIALSQLSKEELYNEQ